MRKMTRHTRFWLFMVPVMLVLFCVWFTWFLMAYGICNPFEELGLVKKTSDTEVYVPEPAERPDYDPEYYLEDTGSLTADEVEDYIIRKIPEDFRESFLGAYVDEVYPEVTGTIKWFTSGTEPRPNGEEAEAILQAIRADSDLTFGTIELVGLAED